MSVLFVDACFRAGSRTKELADFYFTLHDCSIDRLDLGTLPITPLQSKSLQMYNKAVSSHEFSDPLFDYAKQFAAADEIVIAAPCWNFTMPSIVHMYLELVCSQGITFDLDSQGRYFGLCKAKKLTYITTAGGYIQDYDYAFTYLKTICTEFFEIPTIQYYRAEALDIVGADVSSILEGVKEQMREESGL